MTLELRLNTVVIEVSSMLVVSFIYIYMNSLLLFANQSAKNTINHHWTLLWWFWIRVCFFCLVFKLVIIQYYVMLSTAYTSHYNWIQGLTKPTEEWMAWRIIMVIVAIFTSLGFFLVLALVCCIFKTYVYHMIAAIAFFLWLLAGK